MLRFHAQLFAKPPQFQTGRSVELRGTELPTLSGEDGGPPLFTNLLPVSFEEAQQRLMTIRRMDVEPDGYFLVAGGEQQGARWQIDGQLQELTSQIHRAELNGSCPADVFDSLLGCFGWPDTEVVFELVQEGVTISLDDFRRYAER